MFSNTTKSTFSKTIFQSTLLLGKDNLGAHQITFTLSFKNYIDELKQFSRKLFNNYLPKTTSLVKKKKIFTALPINRFFKSRRKIVNGH